MSDGDITKQDGEPSAERVEPPTPKSELALPPPPSPVLSSSHLSKFEKWSLRLTLATLLVLLLTLAVFYGQLRELERQTANFINLERPWVGIVITIQNFDVDKIPQAAVAFVNGGRRPAKVTRVRVDHEYFATFPDNPSYRRNSTDVASVTLILPNLSVVNSQPLEQLTQDRIRLLATRQKTLFVYASIEYEDVLTRQPHWTHGCLQYLYGFQNANSGFVHCGTYNDVDQ